MFRFKEKKKNPLAFYTMNFFFFYFDKIRLKPNFIVKIKKKCHV